MRTLSLRESVREQISRVLNEIKIIAASEFPYDHSRDALDEIDKIFSDHLKTLNVLSDNGDQSLMDLVCFAAFKNLSELLPILGFILRSTSVRNAFEVWGPLRRLSCSILQSDTKLLLSSEWGYSPITFINYEQLPGYVLIGLPAPESANPFLLPLAGHELGHSVWGRYSLKSQFLPKIQQHILDDISARWNEFSKLYPSYTSDNIHVGSLGWQTWSPAATCALSQVEESFCDFLGLKIFGESFLHSLAYVTAPNRKGLRPYEYPNKLDRASALANAASVYHIEVPVGFTTIFSDLDEPAKDLEETRFLLSLADSARMSLCNDLISKAEEIVNSSGILLRNQERIDNCLQSFRSLVPAVGTGGLVNILNAGWAALLEDHFFSDTTHESSKTAHLSEIILKSIEIYEVEHRIAVKP